MLPYIWYSAMSHRSCITSRTAGASTEYSQDSQTGQMNQELGYHTSTSNASVQLTQNLKNWPV